MLFRSSVIGGYVGVPESLGGSHQLGAYLSGVIKAEPHHLEHQTEYLLMGISTGLVLLSILFAWMKFKNYKIEGESKGFAKVLENKWYVDELYQNIIVNPLKTTAAFFNNIIENKIFDFNHLIRI